MIIYNYPQIYRFMIVARYLVKACVLFAAFGPNDTVPGALLGVIGFSALGMMAALRISQNLYAFVFSFLIVLPIAALVVNIFLK